jgi:hypothetical protein
MLKGPHKTDTICTRIAMCSDPAPESETRTIPPIVHNKYGSRHLSHFTCHISENRVSRGGRARWIRRKGSIIMDESTEPRVRI